MITVLTWLWAQPGGRTSYGACHVNIWRDMVARNLTLDHEIACVTDMPEGIDPRVRIIRPPREFEDVRIPTWTRGRPQCFRRLSMFRPDAADLFGAERIVCMDLDVVIGGSLDPMFAGCEDFRMARGTASGRPYNGSVMMIRAGARAQVYREFAPERAIVAGQQFVGSDQAWISYVLGKHEAIWMPQDGLAHWGQRHSYPMPRIMTFPGAMKPWKLAELGTDKWVSRHYRRDGTGRCLVLGYGPSVWTDAAAALGGGRYDAVIASPEAAAHWPSPVLAIADDDGHAERLAAMHGFTHVAFCGRSDGVQADAIA